MSNRPEAVDLTHVRVLVPESGAKLDAFLSGARKAATEPFDRARVAMLEEFGSKILRHPTLRRDPGGAALGFWLRRSHLVSLRESFVRNVPADGMRVAAGLVLHIAPANVDTMFVLSWALSFLAGNANIVRLTTRPTPVMEDLIVCLADVFRGASGDDGNLFITYEHDDAVTACLSLACDTRIIWGGDDTVRRIRAIPLNPHAGERAFASKRSLSVFDAAAYLAADDSERTAIASRMAADLAPFGQMACSSPHVLHWVGDVAASKIAEEDFATRLESAMAAKSAAPDLGWATRRINHSFAAAAEGRAVAMTQRPHTTAVRVRSSDEAEPREICGAGMLIHVAGASIEEVGGSLRGNHQTITYFGLDSARRTQLALLAGRAGADRLVPVGRALDFGPQWDGFDLWCDLTRLVIVE